MPCWDPKDGPRNAGTRTVWADEHVRPSDLQDDTGLPDPRSGDGRVTASFPDRVPVDQDPGGQGMAMTSRCLHPHVYPVEADTLLMLEAAREECRTDDRVLEVGTGSGHIAASLHPLVGCILAVDINPHAAHAARRRGLDVVRTDLFAGLRGRFDLVLFNPPYLPTSPEERIDDWLEYALDGGPDGRRTITRFLGGLREVLAPRGRALLLVSALTGIGEVRALAGACGYATGVVRECVTEGERLVVLRITGEGNDA